MPGFGFEFKAIDGGVIILVFIKSVTKFVEGLKSEIGKRCITRESGLIEIDHFRITKREAGFEVKMIIWILGAQKIEKLLFFVSDPAFHKVIVV